jgi:Xaa-Pro aminopeptidase/Xaa-Pro dipeptidase
MIKSQGEICLLTEAASLTGTAIQSALQDVEAGCPEVAIAAKAEFSIRMSGAELSFTTVMGSGPRTANGTFFPTTRAMGQGEVVVLDCGARVGGYHGDMCRTVVVGAPTSLQQSRLKAVASAVDAAIGAAMPGNRIEDIQAAAREAIHDAGLSDHWWGYFMPHGAGTGQHEYPSGTTGTDEAVREGMVLCIEPGVTIAGEGAYILEDMVVVERHGARRLSSLPLDLWS